MPTLTQLQEDLAKVPNDELWHKELPENPNVAICGEDLELSIEIPDREIPREYWCKVCYKHLLS